MSCSGYELMRPLLIAVHGAIETYERERAAGKSAGLAEAMACVVAGECFAREASALLAREGDT